MMRISPRIIAILIGIAQGTGSAVAQDPPRVVELKPPNNAESIEPSPEGELIIRFDRAMNTSGYSICGQGKPVPKFRGKPSWKDDRTLVLPVQLEPDWAYEVRLNSQFATNFKSADGVPLPSLRWRFATLPIPMRDPEEQRKRNLLAFNTLVGALSTRYSHRDRLVKDWDALFEEHKPAVLSAPTDRAFARRTATMLSPTADLHLRLQYDDDVTPVAEVNVDSLFREKHISATFPVKPSGKHVVSGKSEDGLGYIEIASFSNDLDMDRFRGALEALMTTKGLILDVRRNSGGNELLAQEVASHFVDGEKAYAKHRFRVRGGRDGFGPTGTRTVKGRNDKSLAYSSPVILLTGPLVMSSCESFVLMMRQGRNCRVVGQKTLGSSGYPKAHELGNSVTAFIPSWQDLLLDGSCFEGDGLSPDHLVPATAADLEIKDPILEAGLELLRSSKG